MGIGGKWPKKHWNAPITAFEFKNFLGEDPQNPMQKTIPSTLPLTIRVHRPPSFALRAFQTFWSKPILTTVYGMYFCPASNSERNIFRFTKGSHLTTHMLVHSGIKPFSCGHCDATFSRRDHLKAHQYKHTGSYIHIISSFPGNSGNRIVIP